MEYLFTENGVDFVCHASTDEEADQLAELHYLMIDAVGLHQPKPDQLAAPIDAPVSLCYPQGKGVIEVTPWQENLYSELFDAADSINRAEVSQGERIKAFLSQQYAACPSYDQFRADRAALKAIALNHGLVDDQYVRKNYNKAITALFGALPVSMAASAVAKRAQRPDVDPETRKEPAKREVEKVSSEADAVEAYIAKIGIAKVLMAASRILKASRLTQLDGQTVEVVASHFYQKVL